MQNRATTKSIATALPRRAESHRRRVGTAKGRHSGPFAMSVNLTPMIDVTFLLLIFFLVSTTFKRLEGLLPAELPQTRGVLDVTPLPISPIIVRLGAVEGLPDQVSIVIQHFADQPADFDALFAMLTGILERPGFDADTPVVIQANGDVAWDHVVNAWNAAVRAGYRSIVFSGD